MKEDVESSGQSLRAPWSHWCWWGQTPLFWIAGEGHVPAHRLDSFQGHFILIRPEDQQPSKAGRWAGKGVPVFRWRQWHG